MTVSRVRFLGSTVGCGARMACKSERGKIRPSTSSTPHDLYCHTTPLKFCGMTVKLSVVRIKLCSNEVLPCRAGKTNTMAEW